MIRVKISLGIIAAIIILCVSGFFMIKHKTTHVIEMIDHTKSLSDSEKIEEALNYADKLISEWDNFHTLASVFINNDKISVAQNSISRLKALIESKNDELNAEYDTAKSSLMWIIESEIPRFTNIF